MKKGFTLIELLIVIAIIAIVASVVFVALNPVARFQDARDSQRWQDIEAVVGAARLHQIDNLGKLPTGIDDTLKMIGTDATGCTISCGSSVEIDYTNTEETLRYYSNNTYSVRNWFDVSIIEDFESLSPSLVLDCDSGCSGTVRIRIGNATSYSDYDLIDASLVREDGSYTDYTWYTNTYPINKTTLGDYFFVQILHYTGTGSIRFMMDESGPAGPDPEFRGGGDGDSSQAGWSNDNGDYFIKIGIPESTTDACLDLSSDLSPYLAKIPFDPLTGSDEKTYYALKTVSSRAMKVIACIPEGGQAIEINK